MARREIDAQLCEALANLEQGDQYKGYLARIVRECIERLIAGDASAPQDVRRAMNLPLHAAERLGPTFRALEAATWVKATAQFLEVAAEVALVSPLLEQNVHPVERAALIVLREVDPKPLSRRTIWQRIEPAVTEAEVGQALTRCHERLWVVRLMVLGPQGCSYRIHKKGREALEVLGA
jgi:hypothetical protein